MSGQYTPGPWHDDTEAGEPIVYSELGSRVADCYPNEEDDRIVTDVEACANARLIAAAPELVEALQDAHDLILNMGRIIRSMDESGDHAEFWTNDGDYCPHSVCERNRAALEKAGVAV